MNMINIQFSDKSYRPKTAQLSKFGGKWHNDGNGFWWVSMPAFHLENFSKWYEKEHDGEWEIIEEVPTKPSKPTPKPSKPSHDGGKDLSDLIGAISFEFNRIGLNIPERKKLTQDRYGKTSGELEEMELIDYLSHLKTFPDGGELMPLRKEKPTINPDYKAYQYRYAEKGIIYLVKQWLWEQRSRSEGEMKVVIPQNDDGSVNETLFTDMAIQYLENPSELPEYIQKIIKIHIHDESGRSFIELWAAEKLIRQITELMNELAETRSVDRKEIDREMIAWAESMKLPRRQQMTTEQLRTTIVYLTELLNPVIDENPFAYGDDES